MRWRIWGVTSVPSHPIISICPMALDGKRCQHCTAHTAVTGSADEAARTSRDPATVGPDPRPAWPCRALAAWAALGGSRQSCVDFGGVVTLGRHGRWAYTCCVGRPAIVKLTLASVTMLSPLFYCIRLLYPFRGISRVQYSTGTGLDQAGWTGGTRTHSTQVAWLVAESAAE